MTVRITSNQSSPTVQFRLQADAYADASYGDHGRWRVRLVLEAINTGTSSSQYSGEGYQDGRTNGTVRVSHSANPFLPAVAAGATRWSIPDDTYINANSNGYWTSNSTSMGIDMGLDYGNVVTRPTGSVPMPRIARAPGAPGTPSVTTNGSTSATFSWAAAERGNANITDYGLYVSTSSSFSSHVFAEWVGTGTSETVTGLTGGTTYYVRTRARNGDGTGGYSGTRTFTTLPGAPATAPTFSSIAPTSVTISWATPPGSVTALTGYEYQLSTNSGFSAVIATVAVGKVNSDNTADNVTLLPVTLYYARVRALSGTAVGPWSPTGSFTTLSSSPPGVSVTPAPAGTSATVNLTPPEGITVVNSYFVERRLAGTTTPVTTGSTTSNALVMTGLTPGATYEYRATATIGTYTSPFSAWTSRTQPQPSTNPGQYFDGSSPATANETFRWTSTVNNSTSEMVGLTALNWAFVSANNGGAGVVTRVVGGMPGAGDYAARMLVTVSASGTGLRWGQELNASPSDVVPGTTYYGSMFVNPSRDQRLSIELTWLNDALTVVRRDTDEGVLCVANEWTRISLGAAAPSNAEFALVRVIDVAGAGWSAWLSGESCLADAMMLTLANLFPYFDGDTTDTEEYNYDWEGAPNNSESARSIVPVISAPVIRDPDCPPPPTPPKPPSISSDCIDETGVWRRYWALIPAYQVSTTLHVLPAVVVTTESAALRQLRVRFYQAGDIDDPNAIDPATWVSEMVVSYVPSRTVLVLDSVEQRATASVGGSLPADAGHLLYGSNGAPVIWPTLNCGVNYFVSFDTPPAAPVGNQKFSAILTQRY